MLYKRFVHHRARWIFERFNEGDYGALLSKEASGVALYHPGTHALGARLSRVEAVRLWYERFFRLFPGVRFTARDVLSKGWPWHTTVVVQWTLRADVGEGLVYEDQGVHLLHIKWGTAVSIDVYHDTEHTAHVLQLLAARGVEEAAAPPLTDDDALVGRRQGSS